MPLIVIFLPWEQNAWYFFKNAAKLARRQPKSGVLTFEVNLEHRKCKMIILKSYFKIIWPERCDHYEINPINHLLLIKDNDQTPIIGKNGQFALIHAQKGNLRNKLTQGSFSACWIVGDVKFILKTKETSLLFTKIQLF